MDRNRLLGGGFRPVDELDVGHWRIVACAETALEDAEVTARARLVARTEFDKQLADGLLVAQAREGAAPSPWAAWCGSVRA